MPDYAVKKIDEMDAALFGSFKRARAELGVESFGMQVIDLPPSFDGYPSHDHTHDDQEEVYVALRGGGELEVDGETDATRRRPHGAGRSRRQAQGGVGTRRDPDADPRRGPGAGLLAAGDYRDRRSGPESTEPRLALGRARLEAGAAPHRDPRVARELRFGAGALAEREDRAARVRHQFLVPAGVAEADRRTRRARGVHRGARSIRRATPRCTRRTASTCIREPITRAR